MPWWIWIVGGLILAGLEAALSGGELYLLFIGAAALVVGFVDLGGGHAMTTQGTACCIGR